MKITLELYYYDLEIPLDYTKDLRNKYPVGTTMRPRLAVELTDEQIFWAGLKHFILTFEVVLLRYLGASGIAGSVGSGFIGFSRFNRYNPRLKLD